MRNPLPASGGTEPEDMELVRQYAPEAFRIAERCVTADDYIERLKHHPEVQKAFAIIRYFYGWPTVFVSIDRKAGEVVNDNFKESIHCYLDKYRLAGYDLKIEGPVYVPLYIKLSICTKPGYFPENVKQKLLEAFSNQNGQDGTHGFFDPDNWTFGQPVSLSRIYQSAMSVNGVNTCYVEEFHRWGKVPNGELEKGMLVINYNELIRLDNDPNFPENGKIAFTINGVDN